MSTNTTRANNPMKVITGPDTRWSYAKASPVRMYWTIQRKR